MARVYKIHEIVGTSENSIEDAINNAVAHAAKGQHKLDWFEVVQTRGLIDGKQVKYFQVHLKVGCYEGE